MHDQTWGIHWFRRDLRVPDNQALAHNLRTTNGRTVGLFCFDSKFLSRDDFSHNRFALFLKTLKALRDDWREMGGDLLVVDCLPKEAFARLIDWAKGRGLPPPSLVTFNRDYEPFARRRDADVQSYLEGVGVTVENFRDHLLFEPLEILKDNGDFYQVYAPFARRWFAKIEEPEGRRRLDPLPDPASAKLTWSRLAERGGFPFEDALETFIRDNGKHVKIKVPELGHRPARAELERFAGRLENYERDRDQVAKLATSQLSWFLKNGSLTIAQIFRRLELGTAASRAARPGRQKFAQELVWREFFYSILYHRPDVEGAPFNTKYADLKWDNDRALFKLWQEGRTGVPIVDAGMRQLAREGWITNRLRIIVASFLIKDLLVDWRWGELHFMHLLLDGDTANNNGNWQWAASTGAEAQPFFRVLNPWRQGKRFDPDGAYIREQVPELKNAPAKALHDEDADRTVFGGYPAPVVRHAERRVRAIALYKKS